MSVYRNLKVTIEPTSAFLTPIVADTLWGHLLWAEVYHGGDIGAWVDPDCRQPPLILSDAFPEGWYPAPLTPIAGGRLREMAVSVSRDINAPAARLMGVAKRASKLGQLPESVVERLLSAADMPRESVEIVGEALAGKRCPRCLAETGCDPQHCPPLTGSLDLDERRACQGRLSTTRAPSWLLPSRHTAVDRCTFTALEGQLFDYADWWPSGTWAVWVRTTLEPSHIQVLFDTVGEQGYGRRASIGKGSFRLVRVEDDKRPLAGVTPRHGKYLILSSSYVPSEPVDSAAATYAVRVKRGKRHLSSQFIKMPVAMFAAGSSFAGQAGDFVGRLVPGVHSAEPMIVEYGLAYPVPF